MDNIIVKGEIKKIVDVVAIGNYKLLVTFQTGEIKIYDVEPLLKRPVYKPLGDINFFKTVHIVYGYTIGWSDDIDMCPETIYEDSFPA